MRVAAVENAMCCEQKRDVAAVESAMCCEQKRDVAAVESAMCCEQKREGLAAVVGIRLRGAREASIAEAMRALQ